MKKKHIDQKWHTVYLLNYQIKCHQNRNNQPYANSTKTEIKSQFANTKK